MSTEFYYFRSKGGLSFSGLPAIYFALIRKIWSFIIRHICDQPKSTVLKLYNCVSYNQQNAKQQKKTPAIFYLTCKLYSTSGRRWKLTQRSTLATATIMSKLNYLSFIISQFQTLILSWNSIIKTLTPSGSYFLIICNLNFEAHKSYQPISNFKLIYIHAYKKFSIV